MCGQACITRISATGEIAIMTRPHMEWQESAHIQADEIQVPDVVALGALVTAIIVLCTSVLSAVLTAGFMLVS
jgi:hypothetical protein